METGLRISGRPVRKTKARARLGGSPKDTPSLRRRTQFRPRRHTPPTTVSSTKVLIMMVNSFSFYHHRCGRFLGFVCAGMETHTRTYHQTPGAKRSYLSTMSCGCLRGCYPSIKITRCGSPTSNEPILYEAL